MPIKNPIAPSPPEQPDELTKKVIAVDAAVLTTPEAAEYINHQPATLEQWRWNGRGPKYCKIGRSVRYLRCHLDEFITENVFTSTTEAQAAKGVRS